MLLKMVIIDDLTNKCLRMLLSLIFSVKTHLPQDENLSNVFDSTFEKTLTEFVLDPPCWK